MASTADVISEILGWTYFLAWSISFYPQIWTNWRRKSVVGLSFDYVLYNVIGFSSYTAYTTAFYWSAEIRQEYADLNNGNNNLVTPSDVFFAIHALAMTLVIITQICIYERGKQRVSYICLTLSSLTCISIFVTLILAAASVFAWLWFFYYLSGVKVGITLVKYIPQAFLNFKRKSTVGWNIYNVLLDFTGGLLSLAQLMFDGWRTADWDGVTGNPAKFSLGFISMFFDVLFMVQHYVLYKRAREERPLDPNFVDFSYDAPNTPLIEPPKQN